MLLLCIELGIVELVHCLLIIIIHCFTLKMLTLRIKVFLALTELLLGNLVFCRHSFLCLIIRFLLSQPLFNHCDPIFLIHLLLVIRLINFKTSSSSIDINGRIGDLFLLVLLLARITSVPDNFKLFYLSLFRNFFSVSKLCSRRRNKLAVRRTNPTFLDFFCNFM